MIRGALELKSKTVDKVMVPLDQVFMLNASDKLDKHTREKVRTLQINKIFIITQFVCCFN